MARLSGAPAFVILERALRARGVAFGVTAVATFAALPALADAPKFDGRWRQGPLREDYTVQQWLDNGCGPSPQSSAAGGGEIVDVRSEGDELAFVGGGRVFRTNQCYDPNTPTLARETHSRDPSGKSWRTRCTTPANDSRKAILNTLVVATTDTHIDVIETGRYEMVLESGRCMADVKRTRTYDLLGDNGDKPTPAVAPTAPATADKPKPEAPKNPACDNPGDPTRLEVRPSRKLLKTGDTFPLRALVLDDKGCATKTPTTWQMAPGDEDKGVAVDAKGVVTISKTAPEGTVEIVASSAGKSTRVAVEVSEPAHYDDLLARSGLDSTGANDSASVVTMSGQSVGTGESRVDDGSRTRRFTFIAIVGGLLVALGVAAVFVVRRSRRAAAIEREVDERHDARVRDALERRRVRAERYEAQKRAHEESLARAERAAREALAPPSTNPPASVRVPEIASCPTCARQFEDMTFCPEDGTRLVAGKGGGGVVYPAPAAIAASTSAAARGARRGKICPTCGDRFDGDASTEFCGKDGTQLVLIN